MGNRQWAVFAALASIISCLPLALAGVDLVADPPAVATPVSGAVRGAIRPADKIAKLELITRADKKQTWSAAKLDRASGEFSFADVPGDADYDLRIETTDGRSIEGIDLAWMEARMLRLAEARRKQLGVAPERQQPFTAEDANSILKWIADWKDFLEIKRCVYLHGHGRRAVALVELMRTREFHSAGGGLVWRVELWYFENQFGGWDRTPNTERVLCRKRCSPAEWSKVDILWLPELTVHVDPNGASRKVDFTIPDETDPSRGRPGKSEPELKTRPHVLGVEREKASTSPSTSTGGGGHLLTNGRCACR
jgi:hypothetical protein